MLWTPIAYFIPTQLAAPVSLIKLGAFMQPPNHDATSLLLQVMLPLDYPTFDYNTPRELSTEKWTHIVRAYHKVYKTQL